MAIPCRAPDEYGEVLVFHLPAKEMFHYCDCLRYLLTYLNTDKPQPNQRVGGVAKPGLFGTHPPTAHAQQPQQHRSGGRIGGVARPGLPHLR
jgi:hypothetical protein